MKATTIRLPEELIEDLDQEADEFEIGRSAYIRRIIEHRHRPNTQPNTPGPADQSQGQPAECHQCGHTWTYKGDLARATCPNCGAKVVVEQA